MRPLLLLLLLTACRRKDSGDSEEAPIVHPHLLVRAEQKQTILDRIESEPYATILGQIAASATGELREPDTSAWDHEAFGHNCEIASNAAFLAWLQDDAAAADHAKEALEILRDDFETNTTWDVNIRMPGTLIGCPDAVDLLQGTDFLSADEADEALTKLSTINRKFYERYLEDPTYQNLVMEPAQNNHPIRTAAAIGYAALANPDGERSDDMLDWALSELDYLWSSKGQYIQEDGTVSEGPFYFGFGLGAAIAFFLAWENGGDPDSVHIRNCVNRNPNPPWNGGDCTDGEAFVFENPLHGELLPAALDWTIALRLPSGNRPPLEDAYFETTAGPALLSSFDGDGTRVWDWQTGQFPMPMTLGADLRSRHLAFLDPGVTPVEPSYTTRFFEQGGNAIFRSDWGSDARWGLLVAEQGAVRMTLHDHVDSTSFSMAAYGEYLLLDPGYYKPTELNNARTSSPDAHNVILIDGEGAPSKGLLNDFGDTDAYLENTHDGASVDWAEARETYEQTEIVRGMAFVGDRYFLVADRLTTTASAAREHRWRCSGWAGYDTGGTFVLSGNGARWERPKAGADVFLAATDPGLTIEAPTYVNLDVPYVHEFDDVRTVGHHGVMDGVVTGIEPGFLAVLAPYQVGGSGDAVPLVVEAVDAGDGAVAFRISGDGWVDVAWLRTSEAAGTLAIPEGPTLETDAAFALARITGTPALGMISRGTTLTIDGDARVTTSGAVGFSE